MISRDEIIKIARLSKLTLDENEILFYEMQLKRIIDYMKELDTVNDLDNIEYSFTNPYFRKDEAFKFESSESLIPSSKSDSDGFIVCGKEW